MTIVFHCEFCNRKIEAPDSAGGKKGKCPGCHKRIHVPSMEEDEELKLAPIDEEDVHRQEELIKEHPDMVKKLVNVSMKANDWINLYPQAAAEIVAGQLQAVDENLFPVKAAGLAAEIEITPDVLLRSMNRLEYTTDIDPVMVREIIDYVAQLGYIKNSFDSEDILDLSFLE